VFSAQLGDHLFQLGQPFLREMQVLDEQPVARALRLRQVVFKLLLQTFAHREVVKFGRVASRLFQVERLERGVDVH